MGLEGGVKYHRLCRVVLTDQFHSDGRCTDLRLVPTAACRRVLTSFRMVFKIDVDGGSISIAVGPDDAPLISLPQDLELTFNLRVENPDFFQVTVPLGAGELSSVVLTNAGLPADARTLAVTDNSARQTGGVYGTVVLTQLTDAWLADPPVFRAEFRSRERWWVYYLVTDVGAHRGQLEVVDTGLEPVVFGESGRRELNLEEDPQDRLAALLREQYPNHRRLRFISDSPVMSSEQARTHIELRLAGDLVAGPLPNPSLRNHSTIEVSGNSGTQREASLFQIIKHLTHSL